MYMLCFEGPDAGKGFVILSNGDNPAVLFQCELTRHLLGPKGLDCSFYVCCFFYELYVKRASCCTAVLPGAPFNIIITTKIQV